MRAEPRAHQTQRRRAPRRRTHAAPAEPGLLLEFLDIDGDRVVTTREPTGRIRLTLRGIADWFTEADFADPDAERIAAVLTAYAEQPHT
ncbi:hypothetical protein JK358_38265 [Nocardia sp. 2]|uniref:Uncharacterized protein n=1 Tax=Nocardia acididurans TaxID=2802282 RepID=A0ABS1MI76_9NOCA|nr:hypothetical protein [Nocardia acididurans]MBL1080257.1 hypothetical protein [Nocardia acididurans]